jgi:hypothetical protein
VAVRTRHTSGAWPLPSPRYAAGYASRADDLSRGRDDIGKGSWQQATPLFLWKAADRGPATEMVARRSARVSTTVNPGKLDHSPDAPTLLSRSEASVIVRAAGLPPSRHRPDVLAADRHPVGEVVIAWVRVHESAADVGVRALRALGRGLRGCPAGLPLAAGPAVRRRIFNWWSGAERRALQARSAELAWREWQPTRHAPNLRCMNLFHAPRKRVASGRHIARRRFPPGSAFSGRLSANA